MSFNVYKQKHIDDLLMKKQLVFEQLDIATKSSAGIYYSSDFEIGLDGYEIYSIEIVNWQGATHLFNVYNNSDKYFRLFADTATHIDRLWINVIYKKQNNLSQ